MCRRIRTPRNPHGYPRSAGDRDQRVGTGPRPATAARCAGRGDRPPPRGGAGGRGGAARRREVTREVVEALVGADMLRLLLPKSLGGQEIGLLEYCKAMEALAMGDA